MTKERLERIQAAPIIKDLNGEVISRLVDREDFGWLMEIAVEWLTEKGEG